MDESLSDFRDTKKSCTGPKTAQKSKPRKVPKRPRNQKDIRTVLKSKKNELESYSKDFGNVCKKAGIDVDPEQLQLAIALSNSLQQESTSTEVQENIQPPLTSQERVGKIRKTLLEYGFKVPEIKINNKNKRLKKYKKNYKLLVTSDTEKQTLIANRYSQVLLENIRRTDAQNTINDFSNINLYYLATSATFSYLKDNDNLYVKNLIEKSTSSGNLLRDWSEIPGRPVSPTISEKTMNFSEIECSQDELDVVLSGTIRNCKNIIKMKENNAASNNSVIDNKVATIVIDDEDPTTPKMDAEISELTKNNYCEVIIDEPIAQPNRSYSPDLFEDDTTIVYSQNTVADKLSQVNTTNKNHEIMELTECVQANVNSLIHIPGSQNSDGTKRKSNDFMDITECVVLNKENTTIVDKSVFKASQSDNVTKRKSDDFMELTKCVTVTEHIIEGNIDLTQSPEENQTKSSGNHNDIVTKETEVDNNPSCSTSSNFNKSIDTIIDNVEKQNKSIENNKEQGTITHESLDLTQSSDTSEELPFVSLKRTLDDDNNVHVLEEQAKENVNDILSNKEQDISNREDEEVFDLTQNYTVLEEVKKTNSRPPGASFFEEFIHNHSDSVEENVVVANKASNSFDLETENIENNNIDLTQYDNEQLILSYNNKDIDLTQSSDSTENLSQNSEKETLNHVNKSNNLTKSNQRCSSLGKKDDISIDYDEVIEPNCSNYDKYINLCNNFDDIGSNTSAGKENSLNENDNYSIYDNEPDLAVINDLEVLNYNCSQNSEVFHISDKELDYSMNKSRLDKADNFNFGGISVIDDISKVINRPSATNANNSIQNVDFNDDVVVINEIADNNVLKPITPIKHKTPHKRKCSEMLIETPNNSEFVIKTNNVTPMPCYEAMTTPEIHRELDKYGIKPFKRKRGIQLLTHIYNQLHPVIEYPQDDATPSKRLKLNEESCLPKRPTPRKVFSPRKTPQKVSQNGNTLTAKKVTKRVFETGNTANDKENEALMNGAKEIVYEVTNDPVLKEVPCDTSDWVFQKREKAKVHTCRLPLHIAFHNYVTSRRSLHEAILCYEPIHIDVIHKDLVGYGHKYDPKDLLKFMDKKCITVKTTDNDTRNNKR